MEDRKGVGGVMGTVGGSEAVKDLGVGVWGA